MPGAGTEEYIDRKNEAVAAREAARAGVSPDLLHADPASGVMVTRFIDGTITMTPDLFRTRPGAPERAGAVFAQLHKSGAVFPFRFELFGMIDEYLRVLSTKDVTLPDGYHDVVEEAKAVRRRWLPNPFPSPPAIAIRCARISSIQAPACGSSTGNTPA